MKSNGERSWTRDDCLTENGPAGEPPNPQGSQGLVGGRGWTPHTDTGGRWQSYSTGHFATMGRKPDLQRETRHCIHPDSHVEVLTTPSSVSEWHLI